MKNIVVFISGSGSNLQTIIDAVANGDINANIVAVVSNKKDAYGLVRAKKAGIKTIVVEVEKGMSREDYDAKLLKTIDPFAYMDVGTSGRREAQEDEPDVGTSGRREAQEDGLDIDKDAIKEKIDLIVLSGFMRILTANFVNHFSHKMINIHPSLLPLYKGLHTHQRAIDNKDALHGASVHFVTAELDGGPIVAQVTVPVLINDNAESLAKRVLKQEHKLYPKVIKWFCNERLHYKNNQLYLDNKELLKAKVINTTNQ